VGLVSCDDVHALQAQVTAYRGQLVTVSATLQTNGWMFPGDDPAHSAQAWVQLGNACDAYADESCTLSLFAGSQFDRGRALITQLDAWRDFYAQQKAPRGAPVAIPAPVVAPKSDVGVFDELGPALIVVGLFLLWREFH
jgi:hypothetical protein